MLVRNRSVTRVWLVCWLVSFIHFPSYCYIYDSSWGTGVTISSPPFDKTLPYTIYIIYYICMNKKLCNLCSGIQVNVYITLLYSEMEMVVPRLFANSETLHFIPLSLFLIPWKPPLHHPVPDNTFSLQRFTSRQSFSSLFANRFLKHTPVSTPSNLRWPKLRDKWTINVLHIRRSFFCFFFFFLTSSRCTRCSVSSLVDIDLKMIFVFRIGKILFSIFSERI